MGLQESEGLIRMAVLEFVELLSEFVELAAEVAYFLLKFFHLASPSEGERI